MKTFIIVVSTGLSGAEKRFFDIFRELACTNKELYFVTTTLVMRHLRSEATFHEYESKIIEIEMEEWSRINFMVKLSELLKVIPRRSRLHYPMNGIILLHLFRGDYVTMSLCDCENAPWPWRLRKSGIWTFLNFIMAKKIDVLNPKIFKQLRNFPLINQKISLTPGGTFVRPYSNSLILPREREITIAFVGRLLEGKGILELLTLLPNIVALLRLALLTNLKFKIAGKGKLLGIVLEMIDQLKAAQIPVEYSGNVDVEKFLPTVSIVLSLQQTTNYPSRVVAEALIAGASVIVRRSGDSEEFGEDLIGLNYCDDVLSAENISSIIIRQLRAAEADVDYRNIIAATAKAKFQSTRYIEYYRQFLAN